MKIFCGIALAVSGCLAAGAQVAVKTNLLYDATSTPNVGVEVGIGGRSTLNLVYGLNPWRFKSERHGDRFVKHWVLMPEYRWWTCTRFDGHFIGVHAFGGQLNVANVSLPVPGGFFGGLDLRRAVRDGAGRWQGPFAGVGLTYGYQWSLSRHWNIEAEIGAGYAHMWYDRYPCGQCGLKMESGHVNYAGITKLGVSLMYVF